VGEEPASGHNESSVKRTLLAYIELSRLSNAPTVVSNVLVGAAIGMVGVNGPLPWPTIVGMSIAILLLYIGGMALNDVVDAEIDARERPERPIPSRRITRKAACGFACASIIAGAAVPFLYSMAAGLLALALAACIVLYDSLHKRFAPSLILMGVCRGLVYLTVAAAVAWPLKWPCAVPLAVALAIYIVLVTLIARSEAHERIGPFTLRFSVLLIAAALAPALWVVPAAWPPAIVAAFILIAWLGMMQRHLLLRPPRVRSAVMGYLAGVCLLDAYLLTLLDQPSLALIAVACFIITTAGHYFVAGT
jgi:4-hydroxybenzoate polyprenyltransferase